MFLCASAVTFPDFFKAELRWSEWLQKQTHNRQTFTCCWTPEWSQHGAKHMFVLDDFHQSSNLSLIYLWIFCCFPVIFHHHTHREFWWFLISTSAHTFTLMYTKNNSKRCVYKCLHSRANWSKLSHNDGWRERIRQCSRTPFRLPFRAAFLSAALLFYGPENMQSPDADVRPSTSGGKKERQNFINCLLPRFLFLSETPPLVDNQETEKRV